MRKFCAIIVEPDSLWRAMLYRHLDHNQSDFHFAPTAGDARVLFKRHEPSLLVTELDLPDYGGLELVRQIRESHALSPAHILVLTQNFNRPMVEKGLNYGVNGYLEKGALPLSSIAAVIARMARESNINI